jgi:hypothetical protein
MEQTSHGVEVNRSLFVGLVYVQLWFQHVYMVHVICEDIIVHLLPEFLYVCRSVALALWEMGIPGLSSSSLSSIFEKKCGSDDYQPTHIQFRTD